MLLVHKFGLYNGAIVPQTTSRSIQAISIAPVKVQVLDV